MESKKIEKVEEEKIDYYNNNNKYKIEVHQTPSIESN